MNRGVDCGQITRPFNDAKLVDAISTRKKVFIEVKANLIKI